MVETETPGTRFYRPWHGKKLQNNNFTRIVNIFMQLWVLIPRQKHNWQKLLNKYSKLFNTMYITKLDDHLIHWVLNNFKPIHVLYCIPNAAECSSYKNNVELRCQLAASHRIHLTPLFWVSHFSLKQLSVPRTNTRRVSWLPLCRKTSCTPF